MQCAMEIQILIGRLTIESIVQKGMIAHLTMQIAQRDEKIAQLLVKSAE